MHLLADQIQAAVSIPLLHIADAAGNECRRLGAATVALLGTRFTMEKEFYRQRLEDSFGLRVLTPETEVRNRIDEIIFTEHCRGIFRDESTEELRSYGEELISKGADAVILGCTELPLVIKAGDLSGAGAGHHRAPCKGGF